MGQGHPPENSARIEWDEDDYESLPSHYGVAAQATAGAVAGYFEHIVRV